MAEAKNKLSEVVNRTIKEGRQEIHRRDDVAVMIRKDELETLEGGNKNVDFNQHLLSIPKVEPGQPSLTNIILEGRDWFRESDK